MIDRTSKTVRLHLETLFKSGTAVGLSDKQLLERFSSEDGEPAEVAFRVLVERHGPMVLGVCRRILVDPHDADDAFQAVFLILVRKLRTVRVEDSLGRWLYGVSRRVALRARDRTARRRSREESVDGHPPTAPEHDPDRWELRAILDEELGRLPERYRAPVVLCYLQGQSHEEAAGQLRCAPGTVKSRLARARSRLQARLTRRGLAPEHRASIPGLATGVFSETPPSALVSSTVRSSMRLKMGGGILAGAFSAEVMTLVRGELTDMIIFRLKSAAGILLVAGGIALGTGVLAQQRTTEGVPRDGGMNLNGQSLDTEIATVPRAVEIRPLPDGKIGVRVESADGRSQAMVLESLPGQRLVLSYGPDDTGTGRKKHRMECSRFTLRLPADPARREEGVSVRATGPATFHVPQESRIGELERKVDTILKRLDAPDPTSATVRPR